MFKPSELLSHGLPASTAAEFFAQISAHYCPAEEDCLRQLWPLAETGEKQRAQIAEAARGLIEAVRTHDQGRDTLAALLREYSLGSEEGLQLMCLAEALLRVPDAATAEHLIRDKLSVAQWQQHLGHSDNLLVNFSTWGLLLTGRLLRPPADGQPRSVLKGLLQRHGEPVVRAALNQAFKLLGKQFVLGRDMPEALQQSRPWRAQGYSYAFDMLGEAAITAADAQRYAESYQQAIEQIGAQPQLADAPRSALSIKLSALHPRYEVSQRQRVMTELFGGLRALLVRARELAVPISLDAEEADRLELSLALFAKLLADPALVGWGQLGLVVQAYSKRSLPVLVWLALLGREQGVSIPVRLVKGAYWDSEIKLAQQRGLPSYPVFTRKAGTDLSYLACARFLLSEACRGALYPQFATHNAHTVSCILNMLRELPAPREFEFQRLHGMGEALYSCVCQQQPVPVRIYAPVGAHRELLPYLVRRLLENGANSSFVHQLLDPRVPVDDLLKHPLAQLVEYASLSNPHIPLPAQLFGAARVNSSGLNLHIEQHWHSLQLSYQPWLKHQWRAQPLLGGQWVAEAMHEVFCPFAPEQSVGCVQWASEAQVAPALEALSAAWPQWNATPVTQRAEVLLRLADVLQQQRGELLALLMLEAGKTLADAQDELREAIDFCRYYAEQACVQLMPSQLLGPTGERNLLNYAGRGVFVCISPWNFPLAIFIGQIAAALVSGNCVLAKPAEQAGLIAARAAALLLEVGLPPQVLALLPGAGAELGKVLCADQRVAGVCFTGSSEVAQLINRQLAARPGAIATLIAETGGQNAMIVDSTALPEQLVRDALTSAFSSAGQRCSALRVLYVQEDIAERVIELLRGAMAELRVGSPLQRDTDLGPLIDAEAKAPLLRHIEQLKAEGRLLAETPLPVELCGYFLAPVLFEIDGIAQLQQEHFGPVLHLVRYASQDLEAVLAAINASGYGLTLGVHSRNQQTLTQIEAQAQVGNLYINRNQIGAQVGVQPFGGRGLSGTGPKAGGPHYLLRFVTERSTSINSAALGGNVQLLEGL